MMRSLISDVLDDEEETFHGLTLLHDRRSVIELELLQINLQQLPHLVWPLLEKGAP